MFISIVIAAFTRLWDLGGIKRLAFDETYYVKDAYSLWHLGYEGKWADKVNEEFAAGNFSGLSHDPSFVVHPQTGKWLIGLGMRIFGWDNPTGWRITAAIAGIITVALIVWVAYRLFQSPELAGLAGIFLATDTLSVGVSRIGLLDGILTVFVIAAYAAVLEDRISRYHRIYFQVSRALDPWHETATDSATDGIEAAETSTTGKIKFALWRPWLLAAGILSGIALSVKWSALYALAVMGIWVFIHEWLARRKAGMRGLRVAHSAIWQGGAIDFFYLVPTAIIVYMASWWSWLINPGGWGHTKHNGLLAGLIDLWEYHKQMYNFHVGLHTKHAYQANALQWLLDWRPTSMAFEKITSETDYLVRVNTALGNPLLWWTAIFGLSVTIVAVVVKRDWRAGFIMIGYLGLWSPWLIYFDRTIFMFYAVVIAPFVSLCVVYLIGTLCGYIGASRSPMHYAAIDSASLTDAIHDSKRLYGVTALAAIIVGSGIFFLPIAMGIPIRYSAWSARMWFSWWI